VAHSAGRSRSRSAANGGNATVHGGGPGIADQDPATYLGTRSKDLLPEFQTAYRAALGTTAGARRLLGWPPSGLSVVVGEHRQMSTSWPCPGRGLTAPRQERVAVKGGGPVDNPYRGKHHKFIESNRELLKRETPLAYQQSGRGFWFAMWRSGQTRWSPCSTTTPADWRFCRGRLDRPCPGWSASLTRAGSLSWSSRSKTTRSAPTRSGSPTRAVTKAEPRVCDPSPISTPIRWFGRMTNENGRAGRLNSRLGAALWSARG
jgi:hypothetical protein